MSVLLAIETSQRHGGVALRNRAGETYVELLSANKRHDDDLLPAIDRTFQRAGLTPRDLSGGVIGVSIGPGGFTGLRIAVSTVKMLAEVLGAKIVAVPSALVAAESWRQSRKSDRTSPESNATLQHDYPGGSVVVALACKNDSCWCTRISCDERGCRIEGVPGLCDQTTLEVREITVVLADAHFPEPLRRRCEQASVAVVEPVFDPRACLTIADQMAREEKWSDPLLLLPLYPREPEAVTLWNKKKEHHSGTWA